MSDQKVKKLTTQEILLEIQNDLSGLKSEVGDLNKRLLELSSRAYPTPEMSATKDSVPVKDILPTQPVFNYPIPTEYRNIVDEVLNARFGIQVEPLADRPAFQFTVVVPEEYSNMTPDQRQMYRQDIRPKVISYADGLNGVRDWCLKVYNNLSNEARTKIALDRAQLVHA